MLEGEKNQHIYSYLFGSCLHPVLYEQNEWTVCEVPRAAPLPKSGWDRIPSSPGPSPSAQSSPLAIFSEGSAGLCGACGGANCTWLGRWDAEAIGGLWSTWGCDRKPWSALSPRLKPIYRYLTIKTRKYMAKTKILLKLPGLASVKLYFGWWVSRTQTKP